MQRARQLRELRQGAQQAKYAKQQERMLAQKVGATPNLRLSNAPASDVHHRCPVPFLYSKADNH